MCAAIQVVCENLVSLDNDDVDVIVLGCDTLWILRQTLCCPRGIMVIAIGPKVRGFKPGRGL
jgi:hypothetical protein